MSEETKTETTKKPTGQNWWLVACIVLIVGAVSFWCGWYFSIALGPSIESAQSTVSNGSETSSSLTVNDVLISNNQTVQQISGMYKDFGIVITIIVSLVGIALTCMGLMAKKGVQEFTDTWKTKFEELEGETKEAQNSFKGEIAKAKRAGTEARNSEKKALESLKKIDGYKSIIEEFIKYVEEHPEAKLSNNHGAQEDLDTTIAEPNTTEESDQQELEQTLANKLPSMPEDK